MPVKLLVVDDEPDLELLVRQRFRKQIRAGDYVVEFARSGVEALQKLAATPDIDIVLTDINMPVLDGLKLTAHLRSDPANQALPIVIITTEAAQEDRDRALKLGANAYLIKPVKAQEVLDTVQQLLKLAPVP